jgi:hypothetical protein
VGAGSPGIPASTQSPPPARGRQAGAGVRLSCCGGSLALESAVEGSRAVRGLTHRGSPRDLRSAAAPYRLPLDPRLRGDNGSAGKSGGCAAVGVVWRAQRAVKCCDLLWRAAAEARPVTPADDQRTSGLPSPKLDIPLGDPVLGIRRGPVGPSTKRLLPRPSGAATRSATAQTIRFTARPSGPERSQWWSTVRKTSVITIQTIVTPSRTQATESRLKASTVPRARLPRARPAPALRPSRGAA